MNWFLPLQNDFKSYEILLKYQSSSIVFYILSYDALYFSQFHIFYFYLSKEIRLDVSCESSVEQRIHMKYQILFSL